MVHQPLIPEFLIMKFTITQNFHNVLGLSKAKGMDINMKYTVVIPTYNRAYCVRRAIESVIIAAGEGRVKDNLEIIVVDDGSTDNILEVIVSIQHDYPNERVIFLPLERNGGVGRARNKAIEAAAGEWIIGLDSDDELLPEAFSIIEKYVVKYPQIVEFAFGNKSQKEGCTVHVKTGNFVPKSLKDWFDKSNFDGEFHKVVKRSVMIEFPFLEQMNGGEGIKWYQIFKKHYKNILYTEEVIAFVNVENTDSLLRADWTEEKIRNAILIAEKRLEIMGNDLSVYQPKGKDGLAMSYAVLGKYYIMLGNRQGRKMGFRYTVKCMKTDIFEKRWVRNILMLLGVIKR